MFKANIGLVVDAMQKRGRFRKVTIQTRARQRRYRSVICVAMRDALIVVATTTGGSDVDHH